MNTNANLDSKGPAGDRIRVIHSIANYFTISANVVEIGLQDRAEGDND
jgi:hypothetical protein